MAIPMSDAPPAGGVARTHRVLALLFLAGGVLQFFLAGLGAFGASSFDTHAAVGTLLTIVALVVLILAAVGRREALQASAVLFALMIVQNILGAAGDDVGVLGGLHPVTGLLILGVAMLTAAGAPVRLGGHGRARPPVA